MRRKMILLVSAVVIAAIGATLVLLYVQGHTGTEAAATDTGKGQVQVLTATALISTGETAAAAQAAGKLEITSVPAANAVAGVVTTIDSMGKMVALAPIYPGEQILAAMFGTTAASEQALPVPAGEIAVSLELTDPGRVAGFLTPGSHIAIFVTLEGEAGTFTRVIVQNAEVLGVGASTILTGPDGTTTAQNAEVERTVLTVALTENEADQAIFGTNEGTLWFGLLGHNTPTTRDPGVTIEDLQ